MKAMQAQQPQYEQQSGPIPMGDNLGATNWGPPIQAQPAPQQPSSSGGWRGIAGMIPNLVNRGLSAAGPIQQPPPRPQRPSMQELIAQQPPMQNPWAGQRQVQQQGFQAPQPRPQFAQTQIPAWMQQGGSPAWMQSQLPQHAMQGRGQMMAQALRGGRRRSSHAAGGE